MKITIAVAVFMFALVGLVSPQAQADGKMFGQFRTDIQIPDQQALIHWDDTANTQTLVIETDFDRGSESGDDGGASDEQYAWIVPLPAVPEVTQATPGLFKTLQVIFEPRVRHYGTGAMWFVPFACLLIALLLSAKGCFAGVLLLFSVCFTGLLLPTLGGSRRGFTQDGSVTVHERQQLGALDIATLESETADDLIAWLEENDFAPGDGIKPIVQQYIDDGWVFVATRLLPDETEANENADAKSDAIAAKSNTRTTPPLSFRFQTDRAVYPMRLTGVGNGELSVDLYVFAAQQAAADGFQTVRCSETKVYDLLQSERVYQYGGSGPVPVRHQGLHHIVNNASTATKLSATLAPAQMKEDIYIDWQVPDISGESVFTYKGAAAFAMDVWVSILAVALLIVALRYIQKNISAKKLALHSTIIMACCVIAMAAMWFMLPKVSGTRYISSRGVYFDYGFHYRVIDRLENHIDTLEGQLTISGLADFINSDAMRESMGEDWYQINGYTGEPFKREDSPGNYDLLRNDAGDIEYITFGEDGGIKYVWLLLKEGVEHVR